jgi:hypothetical protein
MLKKSSRLVSAAPRGSFILDEIPFALNPNVIVMKNFERGSKNLPRRAGDLAIAGFTYFSNARASE